MADSKVIGYTYSQVIIEMPNGDFRYIDKKIFSKVANLSASRALRLINRKKGRT